MIVGWGGGGHRRPGELGRMDGSDRVTDLCAVLFRAECGFPFFGG